MWPTAVWHGLHLPGEVRLESHGKDHWFCDMATYVRDTRKESSFVLNAVQRDEVAKLFAANPSAKALVIPYFTDLLASDAVKTTVTDSHGNPVLYADKGEKKYTDDGTIVFGVYVFTASEIVYMAKGLCAPGVARECQNIDVGSDYEKADSAVVARLTWEHTTLGNLRFECSWRTWDLFKLHLVNSLGIIFTVGLLAPWAAVRAACYQLQGISVRPASERVTLRSRRSAQASTPR